MNAARDLLNILAFTCAPLVAIAGPLRAADKYEETPLDVAGATHVDHATHHVQGLAADADHYWASSVDRAGRAGWLYRIDRRSGKVEAEQSLADGDRYHPGGMQLGEAGLWIPLAEYRPHSSSRLLLVDPQTLKTIRSLEIDDHIGALAVDDQGSLYAANWDAQLIRRLDSDGRLLESFTNPTAVAYQDIEWRDGQLWCAGGARFNGQVRGVVDVLSLSPPRLARRFVLTGPLRSGAGHFGQEGFTRLGDELLAMPEDGPHTTIYRFALPDRTR